MYRPGGWPEKTKFGWMESQGVDGEPSGWAIEGGNDAYYKALAEAKKEAIHFDDEYAIKRMLLHLVDYTPDAHVDEIWMDAKWPRHGDPKPDSFIEIEGEIEVIQDCRFGCKHDGYNCENTPSCGLYRIARLKPAKTDGPSIKVHGQGFHIDKMKPAEAADIVKDWKDRAIAHLSEGKPRCECELFVEKYWGINPVSIDSTIIPGADFGQMVNMLAMFRDEQLAGTDIPAQQINEECQKHNDELVKQLAAANARIKELEQWKEEELFVWDPVLDYCHENEDKLKVKLGSSISSRILEILKEYK